MIRIKQIKDMKEKYDKSFILVEVMPLIFSYHI